MESPAEDGWKGMELKERLLGSSNRKGGFRAIAFIIMNGAFGNVARFGLSTNMIVYLMSEYHMEMVTGSNLLFLWSAASSFATVVGAYLADAFVGRFWMIGFGSIFSLLGMVLLWLTAMFPELRPPPNCDQSSNACSSPTTFQLIILCFSLALMSIGGGGIGASSLAFGVDQLETTHNYQGNAAAGALERYMTWYYAASALSIIVSMSCIVYVQENLGWQVGFGLSVLLMFIATLSFFLASHLYVKLKATKSLLTAYFQVIVASYRNRRLILAASPSARMLYHHREGSMRVAPSDDLRFLNKACIIRDLQQDLTPDGQSSDPWSLCTLDQVEELKTIIKIIPLWSTGIIMSVNNSQASFSLLQAKAMDRHITSSFEIPAASFGIFTIVSLLIWLVLYDCLLLPLASRVMGKPTRLSAKRRIGIGIFFSFLTMVVTAIVERIRRVTAIVEGYADNRHDVVRMSAFWLVPQCWLGGIAEAFNVVGQLEFYMSEFPRSLTSIASNLSGVGMSIANLLASLLMNTIDDMTKKSGGESWVSSDINKGHYDYYYWVLAGLSLVNIMYFLVCSRAYGPCKDEMNGVLDAGDQKVIGE